MQDEEKEQLKKMVSYLARVINRTLNGSLTVRQAVEAIRKNGYGVDLSLAACIGVYKEDTPLDPAADSCDSCKACTEELKFEFGDRDIQFLKSINVRINED